MWYNYKKDRKITTRKRRNYMSEKLFELGHMAEGLFVESQRFNTTFISCNFFLPLKKETAAHYALLPFILTSCSAEYPDFSRLNYRLNKLYGARLDASAEKYGDYQLLRMTVSVINDRFNLDGESHVSQAAELLLGLIFEPSLENNAFLEKDLAREKRKAIEHIKGEISEKRVYAKNRLIEEMYRGEDYGVGKCGSIEEVEAITGQSLYEAWRQMLKRAFVRVQVVSNSMPAGFFNAFKEKFGSVERKDVVSCKVSSPTKERAKPETVTERMDVKQGKLCMGFSSALYGSDQKTLPLMVMSDIFGGGPYSRLFSNVREKMSLCYYCSAATIRQKGLLMVQSGVEEENAEKAEKEILRQLDIVRKGEFSQFEFESSIRSLKDSFKTFNDSQASLDMWYVIKANNDEIISPSAMSEMVERITREDVIKAAEGIKLHTVYRLLPQESNNL